MLKKPSAGPAYTGMRAISAFVWIAGVGFAINVLAGVDFSADKGDVIFEILKRFSMFALLLVAASGGAIQSLQAPEMDWRAAPPKLFSMLVRLGVFLVAN